MENPSEQDRAPEVLEDVTDGPETVPDPADDTAPDVPAGTHQHGPSGLPLYTCHKTVEAFKIAAIRPLANGEVMLIGYNAAHSHRESVAYVDKHHPQVGGYYVRYQDGYSSWSPTEAFESGYTLETL